MTRSLFLAGATFMAIVSIGRAGPVAFVASDSIQFGTVNLATGAFTQIGGAGADFLVGLHAVNGQLFGYSIDGSLLQVDPLTGATTLVGSGIVFPATTGGLMDGGFYLL